MAANLVQAANYPKSFGKNRWLPSYHCAPIITVPDSWGPKTHNIMGTKSKYRPSKINILRVETDQPHNLNDTARKKKITKRILTPIIKTVHFIALASFYIDNAKWFMTELKHRSMLVIFFRILTSNTWSMATNNIMLFVTFMIQ